jgi:hypothetical protein
MLCKGMSTMSGGQSTVQIVMNTYWEQPCVCSLLTWNSDKIQELGISTALKSYLI